MNERLARARRILAVQTGFCHLEEWKLSALEREEEALQKRQSDLVQFLDQEGAFSGLFAASMLRRLRGIAEARAHLSKEKEAQIGRLLQARRRMRQGEHALDTLEGEVRKRLERGQLSEAIEAALLGQANVGE